MTTSTSTSRMVNYAQVAVTSSGAYYVQAGGALLRFKGYGIQSFSLESGCDAFKVGEKVHALVLTESGEGVGRITSTRIVRVWPALSELDSIPVQIAAMAIAVMALDTVGKVEPLPVVPVSALQREYEPQPGATIVAPCLPYDHKASCACKRTGTCCEGTPVSHNGSPLCESGSIASGGTSAHCTCDTCF